MSRAGQAWWGTLALLLVAAVWLCASGEIWLRGVPLESLEAVAGSGGMEAPGHWLAWLGNLPGDPIAGVAGITIGTNFAAALLLYLAGWRAWKNPVSPLLAVGAAFFGSTTMWTVTFDPMDSLRHLVLSLCLGALISGAVPILAGLVLALAALAPAHGIAMFLPLAYLGYRRKDAYGLAVPTLATFGVGCLLIPIVGPYRLAPSLEGWHLLSLLPALLIILPTQIRQARGEIYAALLTGAWLTGTAELACVLALGDLAFTAMGQTKLAPASTPASIQGSTPAGLSLSGPALLNLVATLLLLWTVLPGERHLNRQVLIPAQKADLPLWQMFGIFSLEHHARQFAEDAWRKEVPFPEMSGSDFAMALRLQGENLPSGFCPVTLDGQAESRRVALLYALLSKQSLRGWDDPGHLAAPLLLCKLRGKNFLSSGPEVIVRQGGQARRLPPPTVPTRLTPLDFRRVLPLPYRLQSVSTEPGAAYAWTSAGQIYRLVFLDQPAELVFSARPGTYQIASLGGGGALRSFEMLPLAWELSGLNGYEPMPSRSLVPLKLRLTNVGQGPLSSELISAWHLETTTGASFSPFLQTAPDTFVLFPGESVLMDFHLATPEAEGLYQVRAQAITPEGQEIKIPFAGTSEIRTWRRLPPVGTWVEEP